MVNHSVSHPGLCQQQRAGQNDDGISYQFYEGRLMASGPYLLPLDYEELERLEGVHRLAHAVIGSHYIGPVKALLESPSPDGRLRKVLDVGTGAGNWVRDMAQQFHNVEFVGLDIVRVPPPKANLMGFLSTYDDEGRLIETQCPRDRPNVRWEKRDATKGLGCPDATYDIVHCRYVMTLAVCDPRALIREFTRVLKPGGLLLLAESTLPFSMEDGSDPPVGSGCEELCQTIRMSSRKKGLEPDLRCHLESIIRTEGHYDLWETRDVALPLGVWPLDPVLQDAGEEALEDLKVGLRSLLPTIRESGYDDAEFSLLQSRLYSEIEQAALERGTGSGLAFYVTYLWARKKSFARVYQ